jgi:hypothetical protein
LPHSCADCLDILGALRDCPGLYRLMMIKIIIIIIIIIITENGKLLNLHPGLYILMQKAVTLNTCCRVFGRTVNNKSLVSEILYTLESQLNCCEIRNAGEDNNNNNNNLESDYEL